MNQLPAVLTGGEIHFLTGHFGGHDRTIQLPRPMTIAEAVDLHGISFRLPAIAIMEGGPVLRREWPTRVILSSDTLGFVMLPGGGGANSGKQIAGMIAALALSVAAPFVGTWFAGTFFGGSAIASSLASAAFLARSAFILDFEGYRP